MWIRGAQRYVLIYLQVLTQHVIYVGQNSVGHLYSGMPHSRGLVFRGINNNLAAYRPLRELPRLKHIIFILRRIADIHHVYWPHRKLNFFSSVVDKCEIQQNKVTEKWKMKKDMSITIFEIKTSSAKNKNCIFISR